MLNIAAMTARNANRFLRGLAVIAPGYEQTRENRYPTVRGKVALKGYGRAMR
jgi:hypothetical protein